METVRARSINTALAQRYMLGYRPIGRASAVYIYSYHSLLRSVKSSLHLGAIFSQIFFGPRSSRDPLSNVPAFY
jgi:hypothetical protein